MAVVQHTCAQCAVQFIAKEGRLFCGRPCQHESMRTRPMLACEGCGKGFLRRSRRGDRDANRFCSRACAGVGIYTAEQRREVKRARRRRNKRAARERLRASRSPKLPRAEKPKVVRVPKPCAVCGVAFIPLQPSIARYCSRECRRQSSLRRRDRADRKHRSKARKRGLPNENVIRDKVFDRDGWRCQVCGDKTPKRLKGTLGPKAPELDHRIPMALGGGHTYSNVQCACRACNQAKSGTRIVGQLPLWPNPL